MEGDVNRRKLLQTTPSRQKNGKPPTQHMLSHTMGNDLKIELKKIKKQALQVYDRTVHSLEYNSLIFSIWL